MPTAYQADPLAAAPVLALFSSASLFRELTATNGHDEKGRLTKGNTVARGNPFARRMARLRSLLLDTIGDEGLVRIIRAMAAQAEAGDVAAATLLLRYLLGMPGDAPNPDRLDHDQFDIINTSPLTRMLAMVQESADPAGTRQKALKILEELKQRDQEELKQRE